MSEYDNDKIEAIQAVVDRVSAYQDGATQETVTDELLKGFKESEVDVATDDIAALSTAIVEQDGDVSVSSVLG